MSEQRRPQQTVFGTLRPLLPDPICSPENNGRGAAIAAAAPAALAESSATKPRKPFGPRPQSSRLFDVERRTRSDSLQLRWSRSSPGPNSCLQGVKVKVSKPRGSPVKRSRWTSTAEILPDAGRIRGPEQPEARVPVRLEPPFRGSGRVRRERLPAVQARQPCRRRTAARRPTPRDESAARGF